MRRLFASVCAVALALSTLIITVTTVHAEDKVGQITSAATMHAARSIHSATRLPDGSVVIIGGMVREGQFLDSAEIYDADSNQFVLTRGKLIAARGEHSATLLKNGKILVAGGWGGPTVLNSTELYDPRTQTFSATGSMHDARSGFTATLLQDGRVLMVGGYDGQRFLYSAELYDPVTGTFTPLPMGLRDYRIAHTATLLQDGRVLISGGGTFTEVYNTAELYDPKTNKFTPTGSSMTPRYKHAAALLPDGRVLIIGGSDSRDWDGRIPQIEVYDPVTETFANDGTLNAERFKLRDAVAVLTDGRILIAGGSATVELYDPVTDRFSVVNGQLDGARFYMTATALDDDRVLIAGGYNRGIDSTARTWRFTIQP